METWHKPKRNLNKKSNSIFSSRCILAEKLLLRLIITNYSYKFVIYDSLMLDEEERFFN